MPELLQRAVMHSPIGEIELLTSRRGLVRLALPDEDESRARSWLRRRFEAASISDVSNADEPVLRAAVSQLRGYFDSSCRSFTLPLDLRGTPFQIAVWTAVRAVPWGETRTYRDIAESMRMRGATRAVGAANGANPLSIVVPCHRLVGADGTLRGYGGGLERKAWLLAHERGVGSAKTLQSLKSEKSEQSEQSLGS